MAGFYMDPTGRPDPDREARKGIAGRLEIRPARRSTLLGTRSLACPDCEMPLSISRSLRWSEPVQCPFCDAVAPMPAFIRAEGWPEVRLVARLD